MSLREFIDLDESESKGSGSFITQEGQYKDLERTYRLKGSKGLFMTSIVGGKIGKIMERLEMMKYKLSDEGEVYLMSLFDVFEKLTPIFPDIDKICAPLKDLEYKDIPFILYTNPTLLTLAYYYNKINCKKSTCKDFHSYIQSVNIPFFDICRYLIYVKKIFYEEIIDEKISPPKLVNEFLETTKEQKIKKVSEKETLHNKFPSIFPSGYPRFCANQPSLVSFEETEDYDNYLEFPEDSGNYFVCKHKDNPVIGLKRNKFENNVEFPKLPCCYVKTKEDDESELKTIDISKPVNSKSIYSVNDQQRYAYLPQDIKTFFNLIDENAYIKDYLYLRTSVELSPQSSLLCLLSIFTNYSKRQTLNLIKEYVKLNYASTTIINNENIQKIIDNNMFLDAKVLLPIYEKIFKCKIILFCMNYQTNPEGSLCIQNYKIEIFINEKNREENLPYVFLFESMGGELDNYTYPQYEYIVRAKLESGKVKNILKETFNIVKNTNLINNIERTFNKLFPINRVNVQFNNKFSCQKFDSNGFIRLLITEDGLSSFVDPILSIGVEPNFISLLENINTDVHNYNNIIKFFQIENITVIEQYIINNTLIGLVGYKNISLVKKPKLIKMYVPLCIPHEITDLPVYNLDNGSICPKTLICNNSSCNKNDLVNNNENSYIQKYVYLSQLSRCLIAFTIYLFSLKYNDKDSITFDFNSLLKFMDNEFIIDNEYFNKTININRLLDLSSNLIRDKKLLVPSKECKIKLIYSLFYKLSQDSKNIINFKNNLYIPDFYNDIRDFTLDDKYFLLNTKSLILFFNYDKPEYKLNYNLINSNVFYLQNDKIEGNKKLLVTKSENLDDSILICYNWEKYKINSNKNLDSIDLDQSKFNLKLYIFDGEDINEEIIISNNSSKDNLLVIGISKRDEIVNFYSFLSL